MAKNAVRYAETAAGMRATFKARAFTNHPDRRLNSDPLTARFASPLIPSHLSSHRGFRRKYLICAIRENRGQILFSSPTTTLNHESNESHEYEWKITTAEPFFFVSFVVASRPKKGQPRKTQTTRKEIDRLSYPCFRKFNGIRRSNK